MRPRDRMKVKKVAGKLRKASKAHAKQAKTLSKLARPAKSKRS